MPNHGMSGPRRRAMRKRLQRRDGNFCQECRVPFSVEVPATLEHRVPWADGGSNSPDNLELLCHDCNQMRNRRRKTMRGLAAVA